MLPFKSKYILSLLLFITNNNSYCKNSKNNSVHTRHSNDLQLPLTNVAIYKRGAYYLGVQILSLPSDIKNASGNL